MRGDLEVGVCGGLCGDNLKVGAERFAGVVSRSGPFVVACCPAGAWPLTKLYARFTTLNRTAGGGRV